MATDPLETVARAGYATKGVVYALMGGLTLQATLQAGRGAEDAGGALSTLGQQPFGRVLLFVAAVGLAAYALWRFVCAATDPEHRRTHDTSAPRRVGYAISGGAYALLAWGAVRQALGGRSGDERSQAETASYLMDLPLGRWLVVIAGLVVVGVGALQFVRAYRASFMEHQRGLPAHRRAAFKRIGQFGLAARGVAFVLAGGFFALAGWQADPAEARGLGASLDTLAAQPYGPVLLGIVALGFVAYGVYCAAQARYRRFPGLDSGPARAFAHA